jgi:hypothetical protein
MAVLLGLLVAGCDVGDVTHGMGSDANNGSGCVNMAQPAQAHQHAVGNTSNPGQDCMQANCHNAAVPGAGATPWTFAGTLYTSTAGTTGAPGVTVRVKFGSTLTAVTDTDGNFYGSSAVTFPANTDVTSCPTVKPMTTQLQTGNGACNNSGCHAPGGNPGPMSLN